MASPSASFTDSRQLAKLHRHLPTQPFSTSLYTAAAAAAAASSSSLPLINATNTSVKPDLLHGRAYFLIFILVKTIFAIYIHFRRLRNTVLYRFQSFIYNHSAFHVSQVVKYLNKIPRHLSVIVSVNTVNLGKLIENVADFTLWCASLGIPKLSFYEPQGILKHCISKVYTLATQKLRRYYATHSTPGLTVVARHDTETTSTSILRYSPSYSQSKCQVDVLLLSREDGRDAIVELTQTLTRFVQHGKLVPGDITIDYVDAELTKTVMDEPDLLICSNDRWSLDGYPPWQLRLCEIFHLQDNTAGITYPLFLQALYRYSEAEMRFGR